ncbi:outer membrane beta-barrel protein [Flavivirga spongiicola]|uniref:Long-chain fatty acid transport protein n=1 Tax=Flavivirga spongiicola TaxID=421621 RepID=A0ABU7XYA6_9FLAO|nr:outer membrane beta-barrel protein [Flavivirga sp. MEBiC05379]MDO5980757.1 hypothetical protein [Flavivirga sp. MEBiC05379]
MTNKTHILFYIICQFCIGQIVLSQTTTNSLSSSPYSLYGLGISNELNTGKTNALGNTGFAMPSTYSINNLNPASFGAIPEGSFLYDIGIKVQKETLYEDGIKEFRYNGNFSNFSIAFPLSKKSGLGITLIPFTNVGYIVSGLEKSIDGSTDTFLANITGSGGLNDIQLNYGYKVNNKLRLGLKGSYLFGTIKEEETDFIGNNILNISEENFYNGFRLSTGVQYDINNKVSIGGIVNFPTTLNGNQTRTVIGGVEPVEEENSLDAFKLPLEVGLGLHTKLNDKLFLNLDYKKSFWDNTDQSDLIGDYVDQDFIGFGSEFTPEKSSLKYWNRINYRAGFSMDNGNLAIKNNRITNYSINLGLGLPTGGRRHSMINLGYSYGQKGQVSNGLIKENYHTLTLNFSLEDLWFQKRKYN